MKIIRPTYQEAKIFTTLITDEIGSIRSSKASSGMSSESVKILAENLSFFLEKLLSNPMYEIYTIMAKDKPAGLFYLSLAKEYEDELLTMETGNIYICDPFRNKNYGTVCLRFIEKRLKDLDINKVCTWLLTEHEQIINFYQSNGYIVNNKTRNAIYNATLIEQRYSKLLKPADPFSSLFTNTKSKRQKLAVENWL